MTHYGFWEKLPRPFFVLAPMANVTDTVFRQIIVKHGRPDAMFTEFVSCDGLVSVKGHDAVMRDLKFVDQERPIVAQIFGAKPENFYTAAKLIGELRFDGIDINMGCPDKAIVRQGAGASLMKNPSLAQEIIRATQEGVAASGNILPVSVKTRLGYLTDELESWIPTLLAAKIPALIIHARTKKEMSKVPARWEQVKIVVEMAKGTGTLIIGNGDVLSLADAQRRVTETGVDGVMLGRAIFGNPWLFDRTGVVPTLLEKLTAMVEHTELYERTWGQTKNFELMKKHYRAYVNGFEGAPALRLKLMTCQNAQEVKMMIEDFLLTYV
jgi:nifR3 family TIM-barrel protein